jgi:hypothetical protein
MYIISGKIIIGDRVTYGPVSILEATADVVPGLSKTIWYAFEFDAEAAFSVFYRSYSIPAMYPLADWLKKRLTPVKRAVPRWDGFAEATQEFWEEIFDPESKRIDDLRSVFTADQDDLVTIMNELGDRFRDDIGLEEDRPLHVVWRRLELQGKETENLIQMALRRKFLGIDIQWVPLYAYKAAVYGADLKAIDEIELYALNPDDYFLTSRGKIRLASTTLGRQTGVTFAALLAAIDEEIERLLPTHIVYDGTEMVTQDVPLSLYFGGYVAEGIIEYLVEM